ncbi:MAG: EamA family transporter [Chloroflexi bacterium]|nr:EamA family transporter [Chloroflexota bacterium]
MKSTYSRGYVIALTATVLWSFTGILISYLSKTYALPSLVLAFWRDLFLSIGLALIFALFSRARFHLDRSHWTFLVLYGLTLAVFNSLWTFSVQYNGAAVATVLAFSSPAMTAILSKIIFKENFNRVKILSIVLSLLGTFLVSGAHDFANWRVNPLGITFGLFTGLFFAFYNLEGKRASDQSIDSWTALLYSFAIATFFLLLFNLAVDGFSGKLLLSDMLWLGDSVSAWGFLIFLAIAPTLGGFGLYTLSLRYLAPTVANLIATLEPALTSIWAYFLLREQLNSIQWIGSVMVFTGVILLRWGDKTE